MARSSSLRLKALQASRGEERLGGPGRAAEGDGWQVTLKRGWFCHFWDSHCHFYSHFKKERWKKSRNNEATDLQAEREGKRGMINKWGAAGLVRASKVRGTFTPVPQGCRAAKAQLEIRSGGAVSLTVQWWPGWVTDWEEGAAGLPQTASCGVRARHQEKYQQWCNRGLGSCSIYSASLLFISDRLLYSSLHTRFPAYIKKQARTQLNIPM